MRLYNTLTRQEETFTPRRDDTVRMYACGLTVYARGHIGNFRTFVCLDLLRRTLKYVAGFGVHQVVNYTDVDDKTIKASRAAGVSLREYTDRYIEAFREDAASLGLEPVEDYPRATDEANLQGDGRCREGTGGTRAHLPERRVNLFQDRHATRLRQARPTRPRGYQVLVPASIAISTPNKTPVISCCGSRRRPGEPSWDFGVGPGRPGWHIECSAMALRLLGEGAD